MKKILKTVAKVFVFLAVFVCCFFTVQEILCGDADTTDAKRINGFFAERENSLDAVFLGPSTTYAFWTPAVAWKEYGISAYSFSNSAQPLFAAKYLIDDARKTQPNAVYIINVTHFLIDYETYLHRLLYSYPLTLNKLKMTGYLCDLAGFDMSQTMEFFFPIIRFHERWSELTVSDFSNPTDEYKASSSYASFLKKSRNVSGGEIDFNDYEGLEEINRKGMSDLMDYCEKEEVKVLFVVMPQSLNVEGREGKQNTTVKMLQERGFDVLDLRKHTAEIGIDYKKDYYNEKHANIHGSIKITDFISQYLIEKYGFKDKRGDAAYSDWDTASDNYYSMITPYLNENDLNYVTIETTQQ